MDRSTDAAEGPLDPDVSFPDLGQAEGLVAPHRSAEGGERALLCFATHDVVRRSRLDTPYRFAMDGADLSLLNSGRAPLLADHDRRIDGILGVIETAWIDREAGAAYAIARFAPTARGREAQALVAAGVLSSCSMGFAMSPAEEGATAIHLCRWWRPFEVTLCPVPASWYSCVKVMPAELLDRQAAEASAAQAKAMQEKVEALRVQERSDLAARIAPRLATSLGIDPQAVGKALLEAMASPGP